MFDPKKFTTPKAKPLPVCLLLDVSSSMSGNKVDNLNKAVKRNLERFPPDFMFQLTREEQRRLTFQSGISSSRHGGRRTPPYAFTEEGIAMLSSVLHSHRAVLVSVAIMRAFVSLRQILSTHKDLARKLEELEKKYDSQFRVVFDAIRQLMAEPQEPARPRIGFRPDAGKK